MVMDAGDLAALRLACREASAQRPTLPAFRAAPLVDVDVDVEWCD